MEGLRIATPPKYGVEKEKKVRPRVAIPKFGVTSLLSNPVGAIKNLLAGKKGRKKGGGGAAGTKGGGGEGGGDGGGGRRASQFDDLDEAEDQQQTERGDHLLLDDEDGSAAAGDDASQEGDKSKDLGKGYAPPWAGGEGEIPWDDDESRPESHYEFGAGDRLLNPKLFLTHPPVIFDPVEDRVRSRWLSVLPICLIPTIISTLLLVGVWDATTVVQTEPTPHVSVLFLSGNPMIIGRAPEPNMAVKLLVKNAYDYPMQGVELKARIVSRELSNSTLSRLPFCSPGLEESLQGQASGICDVGELAGNSVVTTRDGIAEFTELYLTRGLPGGYQLSFEVFAALANTTVWTSVQSRVATIVPAPASDDADASKRAASTDFSFDSSGSAPWPIAGTAPRVRVVTTSPDSSAADNFTVYAVSIDADSYIKTGLLGHVDAVLSQDPASTDAPPPGGGVVFTGHAVLTSSGGYADFSFLKLSGFVRPHAMLAFVCQGEVLVWSAYRPPTGTNVSLTKGGDGAMSSVSYSPLPLGGPAVTALAGGSSVTVLNAPTACVEGSVCFVRIRLPAELSGTHVVAVASPAQTASEMASLPAQSSDQQFSLDPRWHARFKTILGGVAQVSEGGQADFSSLRFSVRGATGGYHVRVYSLGVLVATFQDVIVSSSVRQIMPVALPGLLDGMCGRSYYPVCRHPGGACGFGNVSGVNHTAEAEGCGGISPLKGYSGSYLPLPWVQLRGAGGSNIADKLVSVGFLPWSGHGSQEVGAGKWSWDSTVQGGAGLSGLTGKLGTSTVAKVQLLTSPAEHTEVQPVFVVDGMVQPMPVRIRLSRGGGALCGGIRACAHVRVHTTPPTNLTAGGGGTDSITVGVVDEMGVGLAGKTVCAVSGGGVDLISSAGGGIQGHASNCGVTDSTGNVTLGPLSFPYDTTLPSSAERLLWFQAHNDFAQDDVVCLTAQHAYIPTCRSKVYGISIIPKVKSVSLAASAGASERNGMLTLAWALPRFPAPATDTDPLSMPGYTDVQLPLTCNGVCSSVSTWSVTAGSSWSSAGAGQGIFNASAVSFTAGGTPGEGTLTVRLFVSLAGLYEVRVDADGLRARSVWLQVHHGLASSLRQLDDRNAARNGSYSACTIDCEARNVSNIGRVFTQEIRIGVYDASGTPIYGAQCHAEMVPDATLNPAAAGQLSGSVSEPIWKDPLNSTDVGCNFPLLSVAYADQGTYRLRISLHGPAGIATAPTPILTEPFRVMDRVELSIQSQPPSVVAGGRGGLGQGFSARLDIVRWDKHTSFMYGNAWSPPPVEGTVFGVSVQSGSVSHVVRGLMRTALGAIPYHESMAKSVQLTTAEGVPMSSASADLSSMWINSPYGVNAIGIKSSGTFTRPVASTNDTVWPSPAEESEGERWLRTRSFVLKARPYLVQMVSAIPSTVSVWQEFLVKVRVNTRYGTVLRGVAVYVSLATDCDHPDGSCIDRQATLAQQNHGGGVTDDNGIAEIRVAFTAAADGLYRLRFVCLGVSSIESPPILVVMMGKSIRIVNQLEGIEPAGTRPTRRISMFDLRPVSTTVEQRFEFILDGDVESSVSATMQLPSVTVLDEFGSALPRSSEVSIRIISCNMEYRLLDERLEIPGIPWPPPDGCFEVRNWDVSPPKFLCKGPNQDERCETGVTSWPRFWIEPKIPTGFYYVFFVSDGAIQMQPDPMYINNQNLPSDGSIVSFRSGIMAGLLAIPPLLVSNIDSRPHRWVQAMLGVVSLLGIVTVMHVLTTISWFGNPANVPIELIILGLALCANLGLLIITVARLVFWKGSTQYFAARQRRYILAMRQLFVHQHHEHSHKTRPSSGNAKVHPDGEEDEGDDVSASDQSSVHDSDLALIERGGTPPDKPPKTGAGKDADRNEALHMLQGLGQGQFAKIESGEGGVLGDAFQFPVRILQGFGASLALTLVFVVMVNSTIKSGIFFMQTLRNLVVGYREGLNKYRTSVDDQSDRPGVEIPPFHDVYTFDSIVYTVVESMYEAGGGLHDSFILSLTLASFAGSGAVGAAFFWGWFQQFRSYKEEMFQVRHDPSLMNDRAYPVVEAGGYVGRQMWSSVISGILVYVPVVLFVGMVLWGPSRDKIIIYFAIPVGSLLALEFVSFTIRRSINAKATYHTRSGVFIRNRAMFGFYDFTGLYLHIVTGSAMAITRLCTTYVDFAISIGRLDRPVLHGALAHFDNGHASYKAMLYLDYIYNAPMSSLLAHSLAGMMDLRIAQKWEDLADITAPAIAMRKKRANAKLNRNRWQLLFTMRCNPLIKVHRRLPLPPVSAWDNDLIRGFEMEVDDAVAAQAARMKARAEKVRLAAKLMGGAPPKQSKIAEKAASEIESPNQSQIGSPVGSPVGALNGGSKTIYPPIHL